MAAQPVDLAIGRLLARIGCGSVFRSEPLALGANNRVLKVLAGGERFLAKRYYYSERDTRDRLGSEFAFLQHAWDIGLRCVPQPLACDSDSHVGLYQYIEGRRLEPEEVSERHVTEAAGLFASLNTPDSRRRAVGLPVASEACFSVADHLQMVESRLGRFSHMHAVSSVDRDAITFVERLRRRWSAEKQRILEHAGSPHNPLPERWRCLSPSDFGFHNALIRPDGHICFLDFEYAGWDDPAKLLGDFFFHPGCPVPPRHREAFGRRVAAPFDDSAALIARARLLEPVFRVKWCCIILNEFLPEAADRRRFADPGMDPEESKLLQLEKAERLAINPVI
jgi:hypothetical protein